MLKLRRCVICNNAYQPIRHNQKACSGCRETLCRRSRNASRDRRAKPLFCIVCGVESERTSSAQKTCTKCRSDYARERARRSTAAYGKRYPERVKQTRRRCSQKRWQRPEVKLTVSMSKGIRRSILDKRRRPWESLVGYTVDELRKHLERQFAKGMSWDNYGEWHIDHIVPISSFSFTGADDNEFKACWALANLRPLWAEQNRSKSNTKAYLL